MTHWEGKKARYKNTERLGVNAVEKIIIDDLNWIFREQPIVDVGIDAIIEIVENNIPTGKLIASQIKSGNSNFHISSNKLTYYASDIHYNYWTNMNIPVILIAYIHEQKESYWVQLKPENFSRTKRQWKIDISRKQKLGFFSENRLKDVVGLNSKFISENIFTEEKIDFLREEIKYLYLSSISVEEINDYLVEISQKANLTNLILNELVEQNADYKDHRVIKANNKYANEIAEMLPKMEDSIAKFSLHFSRGFSAFNEFVQGCRALNMLDTLAYVHDQIKTYPKTASLAILQIENVRKTTKSFSNRHALLGQNMLNLSEILGQISREFKISSVITGQMLLFIDASDKSLE